MSEKQLQKGVNQVFSGVGSSQITEPCDNSIIIIMIIIITIIILTARVSEHME